MRTQTAQGDGKHDLVEELIGDEAENNLTHKPDGSYTILNEIVVDRGPNPSTLDAVPYQSSLALTAEQQCRASSYSWMGSS